MPLVYHPYHRLGLVRQLQCVGRDKEFHWPFSGALVALCGLEWYRVVFVGRVGILLVALVQRITVVPNAKKRLPSVAMNLISADVRMAPLIGDKAP
jgi:hypothetical protein